MSEPFPPPDPETPDEAADADAPKGRDGRPWMFTGAAIIALSFLLSWWSLTKYRVSDLRGVAPEKIASVTNDMDAEDRNKHEEELARYGQSWTDNVAQYGEFYKHHFGDGYQRELTLQDARTFKTGTLTMRGFSTWTGWFGVTFIVLTSAALIAPKFVPRLEPWAWGMPWAGAILFGLFTLMGLSFYFTVPAPNGDGYSQGVDLGNYLAIIGGVMTAAGCVFEGMRAAERRIADLEATGGAVEEADEEPEPPPPPPNPAGPAKNRLQDW